DQIRHRLEPVGDDPKPVLPEVLGLDAVCARKRLDHVVGGNGTIAVHEVVQVARGELGLLGQRAVGQPGLAHQPFDRRTQRVVAAPPLTRHQASTPGTVDTGSPTPTAWSSPFLRSRTPTVPSPPRFLPRVTR